ncbi:hypothetical protein VHEMI01347 [[Torrubiella] hemipterigena]|uniref:Uncharacterized protein n=1 Tax=[Torrubiella] hemipterigena TaxID=1531966 RepID=A0A0A1T797_9HYPO|nr:hypothetical protein VHEMI01347 [[Torrubiella] hemipterigena]
MTLDAAERTTQDIKSVIEGVARGELNELRGVGFYNRTWITTERFCRIGDGVDSLEFYIHSLWHIYYQLALHTSSDSLEHSRIVLDIARIQGIGELVRPVSGPYGHDVARTRDGTLWVDLPFFVADMSKFWTTNYAALPGTQRLNFASFLAKTASVRVAKDKLCQIALMLFRNTFEEERDIGTKDDPDKNGPEHENMPLTVTQLLPAVAEWIREAGHVLLEIADSEWNACSSEFSAGGRAFKESPFYQRAAPGFSPMRWMFWIKKLRISLTG